MSVAGPWRFDRSQSSSKNPSAEVRPKNMNSLKTSLGLTAPLSPACNDATVRQDDAALATHPDAPICGSTQPESDSEGSAWHTIQHPISLLTHTNAVQSHVCTSVLLSFCVACHSAISHPHRQPQISLWQHLCRRLRYFNLLGSSWGGRFCTCRLSRCAVTRLCHASAARVGFSIRKRRTAERRSTAFPSLPSSAGSAAAVLENSCINTLSHADASWLQ